MNEYIKYIIFARFFILLFNHNNKGNLYYMLWKRYTLFYNISSESNPASCVKGKCPNKTQGIFGLITFAWFSHGQSYADMGNEPRLFLLKVKFKNCCVLLFPNMTENGFDPLTCRVGPTLPCATPLLT